MPIQKVDVKAPGQKDAISRAFISILQQDKNFRKLGNYLQGYIAECVRFKANNGLYRPWKANISEDPEKPNFVMKFKEKVNVADAGLSFTLEHQFSEKDWEDFV